MKVQSRNKKRRYVVRIIVGIAIITLGTLVGYKYFKESKCESIRSTNMTYQSLPTIDKTELSKHDGIQDSTIYLGYHCIVYDVTRGKDEYYGEGKAYHYLVARDATKQLEIFGGDFIESKYTPVGILEQ